MTKKKDKKPVATTEVVSDKTQLSAMVRPDKEGFKERVTPKTPGEEVFFFECTKTPESGVVCKGIHFRHAGYVEMMLPFVEVGGDKRVVMESVQVKICVKCKASYAWLGGKQMYDITNRIDLQAWEKTEKKLSEQRVLEDSASNQGL